jgi:hypothetical protein
VPIQTANDLHPSELGAWSLEVEQYCYLRCACMRYDRHELCIVSFSLHMKNYACRKKKIHVVNYQRLIKDLSFSKLRKDEITLNMV